MDREALLQQFPPAENFNAKSGLQKKLATEQTIALLLDAIAAEEREPDAWEAHDIAAAIGFSAGRMYSAALTALERALSPEEARAPIPPAFYPEPLPTLAQLRAASDYASLLPGQGY